MINLRNLLFFLFIFFLAQNKAIAELPFYLDFKYILNNSVAGKKAQDTLKKRLDNGIKSLNAKEKSIQEEEKKIIEQKKLISQDEYIKKVNGLRKKVSKLQTDRRNLLEKVAKDKSKARNTLLKSLNPVIKNYMQEKKIRLVLDKKNIILADEKLDITNDIIKVLNGKLTSIKLN